MRHPHIDNQWTKHLSTHAIGLGIFAIINAPSLKLIFGPTNLVNISAFGILFAGLVARIHQAGRLPKPLFNTSADWVALAAIGSAFAIIILPELLFLRSPAPTYPIDALSLVYIAATIAVVLVIGQYRDLHVYLDVQVMWAVLLSLLYLANIVDYSRELNQHYNTVAIPVALGLVILIGYALSPTMSSTKRHLATVGVLSTILIVTILSLHGRSAFIGGALSVGIGLYLISRDMSFDQIRQSALVGSASLVFAVLIGGILNLVGLLDSLMVDRMFRLVTDPTSEPRIALYADATALIASDPIGYGLGAFRPMVGSAYPHNLFLHAAFSGGWVAGILFAAGFGFLLLSAKTIYESRPTATSLATLMALTYLIFTFMISYSITHSFQVFALLALASAARTPPTEHT